MTLRRTILGFAATALMFGASAHAQEFFQPGSAPIGDLLVPPASSVTSVAATPTLNATAFTTRNTATLSGGASSYTVLSAEDAALLAAQAMGAPVPASGFSQTISTAPTGLTAFPTGTVTSVSNSALLTTPAGVDTGLTAVAIVNGVPVTSGAVTNIRGGYGNGSGTVTPSSFGGSVLVSYGSELPIVGPDYTRQLPGSGLSNPAPIPYIGADRADAVAAAARSGTDSLANTAALSGSYSLATSYTGPVPRVRIAAPQHKRLAAKTPVNTQSIRTTTRVPTIDTSQSGSVDAAGTNTAQPVNESKTAVQTFSRVTEEEATAAATAPTLTGSTGNTGLTATAAQPTVAAAAAAAPKASTGFVSRTRSLTEEAAAPTTSAASGAGGCTASGITLQFDGNSNRFTGAQTAQVKEFGELCVAAKRNVTIIGYANADIENENDALRFAKGRVLRALHALTDAGLDDSKVTRETLVPQGNQPSNALVVRAN